MRWPLCVGSGFSRTLTNPPEGGRHGRRRALALALTLVATHVVFLAAQPRTLTYRDPIGRFEVQYPQRDWLVFPGGGSVLVTVAEKNTRATVHVDYQLLNQPLSVDDSRDLIVQIESDLIRQRQPKADKIQAVTLPTAIPATIVIDYARPGARGVEHVRQFSLVRGQDLFRLLCVASVSEFPKFDAIFERMARSFSTTGAAPR